MTKTKYVDTGDIAEDLELTRAYVTDQVVKSRGFPRPVINITQKTRRWLRSDVDKWKKSHLKSKATKKA